MVKVPGILAVKTSTIRVILMTCEGEDLSTAMITVAEGLWKLDRTVGCEPEVTPARDPPTEIRPLPIAQFLGTISLPMVFRLPLTAQCPLHTVTADRYLIRMLYTLLTGQFIHGKYHLHVLMILGVISRLHFA